MKRKAEDKKLDRREFIISAGSLLIPVLSLNGLSLIGCSTSPGSSGSGGGGSTNSSSSSNSSTKAARAILIRAADQATAQAAAVPAVALAAADVPKPAPRSAPPHVPQAFLCECFNTCSGFFG